MTAPLISIPSAPIPSGGEADWFTGAGGVRLRAALFPAKGAAVGSIVLSGGRTEPIEKYFEVVEDLTARGFVVLVHDWRGQGLSHRDLPDRLAGHASGYQSFLRDYEALLAAYGARLPKPWYAIGHSMGGCLTLLALAKGQAKHFEGAVLSAPMLGIRTGGIPPLAARAMAGLNVLLGRSGQYARPAGPPETFETNVLTHDRTRWARSQAQVAAHPDLALAGPTWGWLDFALTATAYLAQPANLKSVTIPVVICSAEQDKLVDNQAQKAVAANLPKGEFIDVPGAYHEILMETDTMRNIFLRALDALTGKKPAPAAAPPPAHATTPTPVPELSPAPKPAPAPAPEAVVAPPAPVLAPAPKPAAKDAPKPAAKKAPAKAAAAKPAAKAPAAKPAVAKAAPAAKPAAKVAKAAPAKPIAVKAPAKVAAPKAAAPKAAVPAKKVAAKPAAPKAAKPAAKPPAKPAPKSAPKAVAAKPAAVSKAPAPAKKPAVAAKPAAAKAPAAKKPAPKK
ncbi:alpha/beta hydrolase [Phenylobacterium sp.]|uniref:alpha/beta hydrolase n=1 Tax=Phenylobacterium sp. TaxID=1871053 RepID=UPI00286A51C2|nr:alpha/beta hydrolase [Phenylobacterium sp.]